MPFSSSLPRVRLLPPSSASASAAYGFEKPSAIQQRAIVPVVEGRDVIAQAQSGTGKTGTFAISILQRINVDDLNCQALILAPTRELAQQIQKVRSQSRAGQSVRSKALLAPSKRQSAHRHHCCICCCRRICSNEC